MHLLLDDRRDGGAIKAGMIEGIEAERGKADVFGGRTRNLAKTSSKCMTSDV